MEIILELIDIIESKNFYTMMIFVTGLFIWGVYKKILLTDLSKYTRLSKLKNMQQHQFSDRNLESYINEETENLLFYKTTGIRTTKFRRKEILRTFHKMQGEVSMLHFKRSYGFMRFDDKKLVIKIGTFSSIFFMSIILISLAMFIVSSILLLMPFFSDTKEAMKNMYLLGVVFLIYGSVLFMFSTPYISAKVVSRKLKEQDS